MDNTVTDGEHCLLGREIRGRLERVERDQNTMTETVKALSDCTVSLTAAVKTLSKTTENGSKTRRALLSFWGTIVVALIAGGAAAYGAYAAAVVARGAP